MNTPVRLLLLFFFITLGTYAVPEFRVLNLPIPIFVFPLILLVWLIQVSIIRKVSYVLLVVLLFIADILLSLALSAHPNANYAFNLISFILIFYLIGHYVSENVVSAMLVTNILLVSSVLIFLYGVYGFFNWNVGDPAEHLFGYFGITYLTSTRNGDVMYFFFPFCFALLNIAGLRKQTTLSRLLYVALFIGISTGVIFSFARGGWITLFLVVVVLAALLGLRSARVSRSLFKVLTILFVVAVIAFFRVPSEIREPVVERFVSIFQPDKSTTLASNDARKDLYVKCWNIFKSSPVTGIGPGSTSYYLKYYDDSPANHAESLSLTLIIELGTLGILIYLLLLAVYVRIAWKKLGKGLDFYYFLSLLLFLSFNLYGVFNLMIDSLWYWTMMGLSYGLILRRSDMVKI